MRKNKTKARARQAQDIGADLFEPEGDRVLMFLDRDGYLELVNIITGAVANKMADGIGGPIACHLVRVEAGPAWDRWAVREIDGRKKQNSRRT